MREAHDAALNGAHPAKRQRADDAPTVVPPPDFTHVLVYNCSLSDILVTTQQCCSRFRRGSTTGALMYPHDEKEKLVESVARPKSSATARVAEAIKASIDTGSGVSLWEETTHESQPCALDSLGLPLGFLFDYPASPGLPADEYTWHPYRSSTSRFAVPPSDTPPEFEEVMFPLLAVVIPKWIAGFVGTGAGFSPDAKIKRVLYLVSGYGAPVNATHAPEGNSTESVARVMMQFMNRAYPAIYVRLAHSGNGVFRYDANVAFVNEKLRPAIARDRNAVAETHGDTWFKRFKLTVCLSDGTPARLNALMNAFRDMKPYLAHAFQLKRFWQTGVLATSDVDIQRWARAESAPPTSVRDIPRVFSNSGAGASTSDVHTGLVNATVTADMVREMRKHRDAFRKVSDDAQSSNSHELLSFWLRKTRKPVLAVLCVVKPGSTHKSKSTLTPTDYEFHKGVNLEVSMPTGSLCSERNAIGNALASNPSLRRSDMFGIAVLSLRTKDIDGGGASGTTGMTGGASTSAAGMAGNSNPLPPQETPHLSSNGGVSRDVSFADLNGLCAPVGNGAVDSVTDTPSDDLAGLNPLKPCGACKEWLLKIAEVNPGFRVVMFTDVTCKEVFVKEVGQC